MALEEISFTNMVGEEINITNLVNQMIDYFEQKYSVGETRITDFNEGSEIRNVLEAFAVLIFALLEDENEATKLPFISSSYGEWLDKIGENPFINLPRIQGNESTGIATFTLSEAQNVDTIIGGEILLEDINGLEYVTNEDATIYAGDLSVDVGVTCLTEGVEGNIKAGQLIYITEEAYDTDLLTVTNTEDFVGGTDYEEDDVYRNRLLANVQKAGFGSLPYYSDLGASVDGVHDVVLLDDEDYTKKVLVNGDIKPTPDTVLLDALSTYTNNYNHVLNHTFIVDRPKYETLDLTIQLNVLGNLSNSTLIEHLRAFFDGGESPFEMDYSGLKIGQNITKDDIKSVFMIPAAISDIYITYYGTAVPFITTNIDSETVLKMGSINIVQNIIE